MKDDICIHCRFYRKKALKGRIVSERCTNRRLNDAVHFKRCSGFSRSLKSILRLVSED